MDKPVSPSPHDASAAGLPDWLLLALARPGIIRTGSGLLSTANRLALDWAIHHTQRGLRQLLGRPVRIDLAPDASPATPQTLAFGFTFAHPSTQDEGLFALDASSARAIVNAIEADLANLRGAGPLGDAELGLLEYAVLVCLDYALRQLPSPGSGFALRSFCSDRQIAAWQTLHKLPGLSLRLTIAGHAGLARLWLPGLTLDDATLRAAPIDVTEDAFTRAGSLTLRLELPPVSLTEPEFQRMQVGDLLLLGATTLESFAADCRLVSVTQWQLASARLLHDAPNLLSVSCGPLDPRPNEHALARAPGSILLRPLWGETRLSLNQLRQWQSGASIDLTKSPPGLVDLYLGLDLLARAELLRADGQLALRLLELHPHPKP